MRIQTARAVLATALTMVAANAATASAAEPVPACVPVGAQVLISSGPLAVYQAKGLKIIACRGSQRSRPRLGYTSYCDEWATCERNRVLAATGSCVAVESYSTNRYHVDSWELNLFDVRLGRSWSYALRLVPSSTEPFDYDEVHPVTKVVLGPGCAAAWINGLGAGQLAEVRTADSHGRLLQARSGDIDLGSLTRSGTTITWTQGGATRSAELSGAPRWHRPPYE